MSWLSAICFGEALWSIVTLAWGGTWNRWHILPDNAGMGKSPYHIWCKLSIGPVGPWKLFAWCGPGNCFPPAFCPMKLLFPPCVFSSSRPDSWSVAFSWVSCSLTAAYKRWWPGGKANPTSCTNAHHSWNVVGVFTEFNYSLCQNFLPCQ
jgi:hypothetical protein